MALIQVAVDSGPSPEQLVVIMLGSITILGIMALAAVKIFGPIAQAYARRMGGGSREQDLLVERVDSLAQELEQVRGQLNETQERLDFAERLLSQGRPASQLPRG
jgi:cell shape-determining protein MreC